MSDAQGWVLIGGFLTIFAAMSGLLLRIVDVRIDGLRGELLARLDALNARLDALERDLDRIFRHVFHLEDES